MSDSLNIALSSPLGILNGPSDVHRSDSGTFYVTGAWGDTSIHAVMGADELTICTDRPIPHPGHRLPPMRERSRDIDPLVVDGLLPLTGELDDDTGAFWYAWGRMDAGEKGVVIDPNHSRNVRSQTASAWHFGRLWANGKAQWHERGGYWTSMQGAWQNYVASGGRSLTPGRQE